MEFLRAQLSLCGMSVDAAAQYFDVHRRVVRGWIFNPDKMPQHVHTALVKLFAEQEEMAEEIVEAWEESGRPDTFKFAVSSTDEEAQEMGWPCVSAQMVPPAIAQTVVAPARIEIVSLTTSSDEARALEVA
jgi:uncharacterized protein YbaA (DUF1428 family)